MKPLFNIRISILTLVFIGISSVTFAQKYSNKGDRYYDKNLFDEAIEYYLLETKVRGSKSKDYAWQRLADCYRNTGQFALAEKTYQRILKKKANRKNPDNYLKYGQSLKSSAKYAEAKVQFEEYIRLRPEDPIGPVFLISCDSAQQWLYETIGKEATNLERLNSPAADFAPVLYRNTLVYSSSREGTTAAFISFDGGAELNRLDLFSVKTYEVNGTETPDFQNLDALNSPAHEGSATFSRDGNEVYFSRTIRGKKDKRINQIISTLQVFYSKLDTAGVWIEPVSAFAFNSSKYSIGQPSLSITGDTIYYISDMFGGKGKTDIYYSVKKDDSWGEPVNMGSEVNTFGHELFPYISASGAFYFSSNSHPGMGKLDIFSASLENGKWTRVTNLKPPINSIANDFGIVMDGNYKRGFFSSDRFNGVGAEDIYSFSDEEVPVTYIVKGDTILFANNKIFDGARYKIRNLSTEKDSSLVSSKGYYRFHLESGVNYILTEKKSIMTNNKISLTLKRDAATDLIEFSISASKKPIKLEGYLFDISRDSTGITATSKNSGLLDVSADDSQLEKLNSNEKGHFFMPQELTKGTTYFIKELGGN